MNKQTFSTQTLSTLKVIILALVFGLGLSYAQAVWTGPLASPPNCTAGNPGCDAPINVSATAQTKTGNLTAGGVTLSNYTSSGLGSVVSPSGASYASALFLNTTFSGFYKQTALAWRWSVMENGDTNQPGKANASDFCINGGGCLGAGGGIPIGGIIMWSGSVANIPSGWKLCDGNNGTPNLRDRFIVGAGTTYTAGTQGGSTNIPDHKHWLARNVINSNNDVTFSARSATEAIFDAIPSQPGSYRLDGDAAPNEGNDTGNAFAGGGSYGLITPKTVVDQATPSIPPYYALAFIMRTL